MSAAIAIDWTRCDGHGLCEALAPGTVTRDEWGFPVLPRTELPEAQARRLVAACPALALRLERKVTA